MEKEKKQIIVYEKIIYEYNVIRQAIKNWTKEDLEEFEKDPEKFVQDYYDDIIETAYPLDTKITKVKIKNN